MPQQTVQRPIQQLVGNKIIKPGHDNAKLQSVTQQHPFESFIGLHQFPQEYSIRTLYRSFPRNRESKCAVYTNASPSSGSAVPAYAPFSFVWFPDTACY